MRRSDSKIQFFLLNSDSGSLLLLLQHVAAAVAVSLSDDVKVVVDHFNITMSTSRCPFFVF